MAANQEFLYEQPVLRPTFRTWVRHLLLLFATFCTATIAGVLFPFGQIQTLPDDDPQTLAEFGNFILALPAKYITLIGGAIGDIFTRPDILAYGLSFSLSLLFILICHEMGHYMACRIYKVDATLPYFIPTPPMIGPAGTFGAFIKIMSPMPSRKAVFDIGVAGPIAGFIALIPIALTGLLTMKIVSPEQAARASSGIAFSDSLLVQLFAWFIGIDLHLGVGNAFYFAAWVGLLVTALNLIPSGQLDGGHAIYAVFGEMVHRWTGRIAFVVMAVLSILGWFVYGSPSGFLIAVLLGVMMRVKHPQPWDQTPLDGKRKLIAAFTLLIFILSFVPFPLQLN
ncbi:MAG TPA: site-2 protease family protein [Pyrinomonadaceae bacterium]|nr:site-2 protease family protein [Pyrinomonadaceae bacterium]